jgi:hypothetical protein
MHPHLRWLELLALLLLGQLVYGFCKLCPRRLKVRLRGFQLLCLLNTSNNPITSKTSGIDSRGQTCQLQEASGFSACSSHLQLHLKKAGSVLPHSRNSCTKKSNEHKHWRGVIAG